MTNYTYMTKILAFTLPELQKITVNTIAAILYYILLIEEFSSISLSMKVRFGYTFKIIDIRIYVKVQRC